MAIAALIPQAFAQTCATISPANAPTFASGYSGRVVMNGLKNPRGLIFDNQGNMLTTEQAAYGVRYIQLTDNGGTDVCVKSNKQLIADSSVCTPLILLRWKSVISNCKRSHVRSVVCSPWEPSREPMDTYKNLHCNTSTNSIFPSSPSSRDNLTCTRH